MKKLRVGVVALSALLTACTANRPPKEHTDDGLVRVWSAPEAGVYRNLGADFLGYKRLMIEPITVSFEAGWRRQHPDVSDSEIHRIVVEAAQMFREEFVRILIDEGPYELADVREPDVFVLEPRLLDLDIPAPEVSEASKQVATPRPIAMQMTGELRDGVSGTLLLRVIMFDGQDQDPGASQARWVDRTINAHAIRVSLRKWSRLMREAIDVAKVSRPTQNIQP